MTDMFPHAEFPSVAVAIQDGIDRRLHTGVQIYVSSNGKVVIDAAIGESAPQQPMTSETLMPWRSAGKPLTAILLMQHIEAGLLRLDARVGDLLPEFQSTEKAVVTVFDMLTHQSGFPQTETGWPHCEWSESISNIQSRPRQLEIGIAAYHPQSSWFLLGEILRRLEFADLTIRFSEVLERQLLNPLKMNRTTCGIEPSKLSDLDDKLPLIYERDKGLLVESNYCRTPWLTQPSPGAGLRGPVSELGRFYEMLWRGGTTPSGQQLVSNTTIQQMTSRHRVGKFDQTLQHTVDFGLGVVCNSNEYGAETVPYGFGQYCSEGTFGHGGSQCSMAFCDPDAQLVVAWSANGFCGEGQHQRRNRMINNAIYEDLGFQCKQS
jgi:CubicO group peptidase (beta-lactamase class C family)